MWIWQGIESGTCVCACSPALGTGNANFYFAINLVLTLAQVRYRLLPHSCNVMRVFTGAVHYGLPWNCAEGRLLCEESSQGAKQRCC